MRKRLLIPAFVALTVLTASAPAARAESASGLGALSGYRASVENTLKSMFATLDRQIDALSLRPPTSADSTLPPIAVVKFSTTNTDGNPVPCELTLAKLRAVLASTAPSPADKARFEKLQSRGIERCHASDDRQANAYLSEALGMIGR